MISEKDSITVIKGIGPKKASLLNQIGIYTIIDLLNYYPSNYKDRGALQPIDNESLGNKILTNGIYLGNGITKFIKKNMNITVLPFSSEDKNFNVIYYNQPYRKDHFTINKEYILYGTVAHHNGAVSLLSPEIENTDRKEYLKEGKFAVYSVPAKLPISQKEFSFYIKYALNETDFTEQLPFWIFNEYPLPSKAEAYHLIHTPQNDEDIAMGNQYFQLIKFLKFFVCIRRLKSRDKKQNGVKLSLNRLDEFIDKLNFTLTKSQHAALQDIKKDVSSGIKMNRLLQGDVGSGKTAVAAAAAFMAAESGCQAVICAPTEILAKQHYQKYKEMFEGFGHKSAVLYSSMFKKERDKSVQEIQSGEVKVVFGTHALFSKDVNYNRLSLIIIDEQQRYGVAQRAILESKGESPHVLVMSATPIPRTLSLSFYKDLDISILNELPKGRKPIKTFTADSSSNERIYQFIKENANKGLKSYIVCPAIEEESMENVQAVYKEAAEQLSPIRIACLSGETPESEKNRIMEQFAYGDIMVLIATTVIEVGVDVPDATVIMIKGCERFGLAQLHQLRGRVGRADKQSYCILHTDHTSEKVIGRLEILKNTNDGFKIAQEDLKMRGEGELFGMQQSGKGSSIIYEALLYENLFLAAEKIYDKLLISSNAKDMELCEYLSKTVTIEMDGIVLN